MSVRKVITAAFVIGLIAAPSKASADWLFTPFVGWNWGGTANFADFPDFEDRFEQRTNFGVSFGWMGAGVIGWEVDFGFSPNFFEDTGGPGDFAFGESNVTTVMGNIVIGVPLGGQHGPGFRPYASGGAGIIKSNAKNAGDVFEVHATDWGYNIGAGAMFFFTDNVGVRADLRYFRSLQDTEPDGEFDLAFGDFRFWRGTFGATFRF
jgi:opacity protein-like surface antigen